MNQKKKPSLPETTGETILIVEDSSTQAAMLVDILERHGYATIVVENGKDALKLLDENTLELVISDVLMPEMDGYALCEKIKANPKMRDISVILLTKLAEPEDIIKGLRCGADNFIAKPFDEENLISRIRYCLASHKLREVEGLHAGFEVIVDGQKQFITSERKQILDFLLSTYELTAKKHRELLKVQNELMQLNKSLVASERRFRLLAESVWDFIWTIDLEERITYASPSSLRIHGYTPKELVGRMIGEVLITDSLNFAREQFQQLLAGDQSYQGRVFELQLPHKDGRTIWGEVSINVLHDRNGDKIGLLGVTRDITERKLMQEELVRLATIDVLTGAANRGHFMNLGAKEIMRSARSGFPISVLILDVDKFKQINDTHGHAAGDEVLRTLVYIAQDSMRSFDIIGRIGGEEFAIILPATGIESAFEVAERLRKTFECTKVQIDGGKTVSFTVSIGVASEDKVTSSLEDILKKADAALYQAKENGRNRCVRAG